MRSIVLQQTEVKPVGLYFRGEFRDSDLNKGLTSECFQDNGSFPSLSILIYISKSGYSSVPAQDLNSLKFTPSFPGAEDWSKLLS